MGAALKVLFDTSVLTAGLVESHPFHQRSVPWLNRAKKEELDFLVSQRTLAELYSALTTLPLSPRLPPSMAWELIEDNVASLATTVSLASSDYLSVLKKAAHAGLTGGIVHDAVISRAAQKAGADVLLTLNPRHFLRVWPEGAEKIREP